MPPWRSRAFACVPETAKDGAAATGRDLFARADPAADPRDERKRAGGESGLLRDGDARQHRQRADAGERLHRAAEFRRAAGTFSVGSWTLGSAIDLSSGSTTANGLFGLNLNTANIFGSNKNNWAGLFAGYIRIDPSTDGSMITKTFVVASDDGFQFGISNGTAAQTMKCNQGRAMTTNFAGTNYYAGCSGTVTPSTKLAVTFPATGGLFPFDLLYFNGTGDQGLELSWADGTPTAPEAGALDGYVLVPADHIYAPAVQALMTVSDPNSTGAARRRRSPMRSPSPTPATRRSARTASRSRSTPPS